MAFQRFDSCQDGGRYLRLGLATCWLCYSNRPLGRKSSVSRGGNKVSATDIWKMRWWFLERSLFRCQVVFSRIVLDWTTLLTFTPELSAPVWVPERATKNKEGPMCLVLEERVQLNQRNPSEVHGTSVMMEDGSFRSNQAATTHEFWVLKWWLIKEIDPFISGKSRFSRGWPEACWFQAVSLRLCARSQPERRRTDT